MPRDKRRAAMRVRGARLGIALDYIRAKNAGGDAME
jgi:hypothetical protein